MQRAMSTTTMMMMAGLTMLAACEEARPAPQNRCGVRETETQALERIIPVLDVALDDDLGGLVCTALVDDNACQEELDTSCIGELDAEVDVATTVTVGLRAQQLSVSIASVVVESDCGWSLEDESGFNIDEGSEVPLEIAFVGAAAGRCDGKLIITTSETRPDSTITVSLRATVTAD